MNIEPIKPASTAMEMRAEIMRLRRFDAIVQSAMYQADSLGYSGEDRYTLIAYHALQSMKEMQSALLINYAS